MTDGRHEASHGTRQGGQRKRQSIQGSVESVPGPPSSTVGSAECSRSLHARPRVWTLDYTSKQCSCSALPALSAVSADMEVPTRGYPGRPQQFNYGPAGGFPAGTMQQPSFGRAGSQLPGPNFPTRPDGSSSSGATQQQTGLNKDTPMFSQPPHQQQDVPNT